MILKSILSPVTKRHVEQKLIKTHPLHLFRIIQDVDDYMNFLPLCSYSKIIRKSPDGRSFDGTLRVGKPPLFSEEYTSRVTVIPETLTVETTSIESQRIDSLRSRWSLKEAPRDDIVAHTSDDEETKYQCQVHFELEMTVSDPVIVTVLDQVLQQVAGRQVEAFEKRCEEKPLPINLIRAAELLKKEQ